MKTIPDISRASETLIKGVFLLNIIGVIFSFFISSKKNLYLFIILFTIGVLFLRIGISYHSKQIIGRSKI